MHLRERFAKFAYELASGLRRDSYRECCEHTFANVSRSSRRVRYELASGSRRDSSREASRTTRDQFANFSLKDTVHMKY